jgi:serine protease AprX
MTGQMGHSARRLLAAFFAFTLLFAALPGTSWTAPSDPNLTAGDYALVQVAHGTARAVAAKAMAAGATDVATLDTIDVITARVSQRAIDALRADTRVAFVGADTVVQALDSDWNYEDPYGDPSVAIDAISAPKAWSTVKGEGVTVAIMDTGIAKHEDLEGSVRARIDFVGDGATQLDPGGHGTFVAGLIAAHGENFRGVAPEASLVSLRVLDANGQGTMHSVLSAFDWLLRNRVAYRIRVLNLSLGAPQALPYQQELLAGVVESAWFAGVVVVAAAGNRGPQTGTISSPGADPFIVTVGSFGDQGTSWLNDDRESTFSSRGPTLDGFTKPDILAPGEHVLSLRVSGCSLDRDSSWGWSEYARLSGTSASSALVAGEAALVIDAHPAYTPTQVKGAIVASGRKVPGSRTRGADAATALVAQPSKVNVGLVPSAILLRLLARSGMAAPQGVSWDGISWEAISWETVNWQGISWESVSWEAVSWEGATWERLR